MKKTLLLIFCFAPFAVLWSQLPNNSIAPDWTLTDIDGNTHTLYDYLDDGKTVYLKFSATWCGTCWTYHNTGAFGDMWDEYGPDGTDEAMLFFIEGDPNTNTACLHGDVVNCNSSTQGDWVTGTPYPIIDLPDATVRNAYQVNGYPTVYAICPDRKTFRPGNLAQPPKSVMETYLSSCALSAEVESVVDEMCYGEQEGHIEISYSGGHGAITFNWSNGSNSQNVYNLAQGTYSVTLSDNNDRQIYLEDIEVEGPSSPLSYEIEEINHNLCEGDGNGSISVSVNGGTPPYSLEWNNGQTTSSIAGLDGGDYFLTIMDANDCELNTAVIEVEEPDELIAIVWKTDATCEEDNGEIDVVVSGGTPAYLIDIGFGFSPTNSYTELSPGNYDIEILDQNLCQYTTVGVLENIPSPEALIEVDDIVFPCDADSVKLDGSGSSGVHTITFEWKTDDGEILSGGNTDVAFAGMAGTYQLIVIDTELGCGDSVQVVISKNPNTPLADAGSGGVIDCQQIEWLLDGSASSQGAEYIHSWNTADGNIVWGLDSVVAMVNSGGTYEIEVTHVPSGCKATSSTQVEQEGDFPEIVIVEPDSLSCSMVEVILSGEGSASGNDIKYRWKFEEEYISDSIAVVVSDPGIYTFEVEDESNGCVSFSSVVVEANTQLPEVFIEVEGRITCYQSTVVLDGSASDSGPDYELQWTTENGQIEGADTSLVVIALEPGTYTLEIVNISTGCVNAKEIEVEDERIFPSADFSIQSDELKLDFFNHSEGDSLQWEWDFGDGSFSTLQEPSHTYDQHGVYEICLTAINPCGSDRICDSIWVALSSVNAHVTDVSCYGNSDGHIEVDVIGNEPFQFLWNTGDSLSELSNLQAGAYSLTVTDDIGWEMELTVWVSEPDPLELIFEEKGDVTDTEQGYIIAEAAGGTAPYSYLWSNGATSPTNEDLEAGEYSLTVTDDNNCTGEFGPFFIDDLSFADEMRDLEYLELYPNPFSESLFIQVGFKSEGITDLRVRNILGQVVYESTFEGRNVSRLIPAADWMPGYYVLELSRIDGRVSKKLLKK